MTDPIFGNLNRATDRLRAAIDQYQRVLQVRFNEVAPLYAAGDGVIHDQTDNPLTPDEAESRVWQHMKVATDPSTGPALARIAKGLADELTTEIQQAQGAQA
jgi:hypothetical protein